MGDAGEAQRLVLMAIVLLWAMGKGVLFLLSRL
jgi:hypothetical protein